MVPLVFMMFNFEKLCYYTYLATGDSKLVSWKDFFVAFKVFFWSNKCFNKAILVFSLSRFFGGISPPQFFRETE